MSHHSRETTGKDIDRFDDIFHQYGDDENDPTVDIDDIDRILDKDNYVVDDNESDDDVKDIIEIETFKDDKMTFRNKDEEHLSQKLSQLSASDQPKDDESDVKNKQLKSTTTTKKRPSLSPTTTTVAEAATATTTTNIAKKRKPNEEAQTELKDIIQNYLSNSKKAFDQMITPYLEKSNSLHRIEYFRQIASFLHEIESTNLDQLLWKTYLRSGTGTLKSQNTTTTPILLLWPPEVKSKMIAHGHTTATNPEDIDHESCVDYVHRVLQKFDNHLKYYDTQVKEIKKFLNNLWTKEIEEAITKFVQQYGVTLSRIPIEGQISIVEYNYNERLLELEYEREKPNQYQKEVFQNLTRAKHDYEVAKFELDILKQRMAYNHLPKSFDTLQIPAPIALNTITNTDLRQYLTERCQKILQRTKSDMMLIYITTAEQNMYEKKKKFEDDMYKMKRKQSADSPEHVLSQKMLNIIQRHFKHTDERLLCLYKLKIRFFDKAPTVKK